MSVAQPLAVALASAGGPWLCCFVRLRRSMTLGLAAIVSALAPPSLARAEYFNLAGGGDRAPKVGATAQRVGDGSQPNELAAGINDMFAYSTEDAIVWV